MSALQEYVNGSVTTYTIEEVTFDDFDVDWGKFNLTECLYLKNSTFRSFEGLEDLTQLTTIYISGCVISEFDTCYLENLTELKTLNITNYHSENLTISGLLNLKELTIFTYKYQSLELINLPKLRRLTLDCSQLNLKIDRISSSSIEILNIRDRVDIIPNLPKLRILKLNTARILPDLSENNIYKVNLMDSYNRAINNKYKFNNYKQRLILSSRRSNLLRLKIKFVWNTFFYSQTRDGFNRFSYLAQ